MLTAAAREYLESVVRRDTMPWRPLGPGSTRLMGDRLARVDVRDRAEASSLAEELRQLGFEVAVLERATRMVSATNDALVAAIVLAIKDGANIADKIAKLLKNANDIPDNWRKLLDRIRPKKPLLHEVFDLPALNDWLDATYGKAHWRYDPFALRCRQVFESMIYEVVEEIRGERLLLVIEDGQVQGLLTATRPRVDVVSLPDGTSVEVAHPPVEATGTPTVVVRVLNGASLHTKEYAPGKVDVASLREFLSENGATLTEAEFATVLRNTERQ